MKKLVIYYSLEGNSKFISEAIASAVDADVLELKPKKDIPSKGFLRYVWGGKAVMMKEIPELFPLEKNPQDYDLVFIGTPVWAGTYAPAFNAFFQNHPIAGKKVALFCCHAGGKGKVFKKLRESLCDNEICDQIDFQDPLKNSQEESKSKVQAWAKEIVSHFEK